MKLNNYFIFFTVFLLLFFFACGKKDSKKPKYKLKTESVSLEKNTLILKGVNFYNTKSGSLSWKLNSKIARIKKKKRIANLKGVIINFKKEKLTIKSNLGTYNLKTKDGTVYDNVTVNSDIGTIKTKKIFFKNSKKLIDIKTPFTFKGKNFLLTGNSMKFYIDKNKILIKGKVKTLWKE